MAGIINNEIIYTPFIDTITKKKPLLQDLLRMLPILRI
jgi:6-phosphofructokinase 1